MSKQNSKLPDLEKSLAEITQLVEKMEQQELTLEQSLAHFERGIHLIKHCQTILDKADQKVAILLQAKGNDTLAPFTELEPTKGENPNDDD